ncbi:MAG TPA: YCF48-related protein [Paludibaculum sp.]|jgi:photosystem II stability/assembly factor-like uncharacterized protein
MMRTLLVAVWLSNLLMAQDQPPNPDELMAWPRITGYVQRIAVQSRPARVWVAGEGVFRSPVSPSLGTLVHDPPHTGFENWTPKPKSEQYGEFLDLRFSTDGSLGWLATDRGFILRSTDGGETWNQAVMTGKGKDDVPGSVRRLSFTPDGQRGVAVAQHGLWLTEDAGAHWEHTLNQDSWHDVCLLPDGRTAIAVGWDGWTTRSADGGRTWTKISHNTFLPLVPGLTQTLTRVVFSPNGQLGWIGGEGGTILRTENGGRSWRRPLFQRTSP